METRPRLLALLDAILEDEGATPGLSGKVGIGAGRTWWIATFDRAAVTTRFSATLDRDVDAALFVSTADAERMVAGEKAHAPKVFGDRRLLSRIFDRYLARIDLVGIRTTTQERTHGHQQRRRRHLQPRALRDR